MGSSWENLTIQLGLKGLICMHVSDFTVFINLPYIKMSGNYYWC